MTRRILREALIFGTIGVVATGLHYGIYWCLLGVMRPGWAYTLGYGVSLVVNFLLNASLTFRAQATARRGLGFLGAHAVNYFAAQPFSLAGHTRKVGTAAGVCRSGAG